MTAPTVTLELRLIAKTDRAVLVRRAEQRILNGEWLPLARLDAALRATIASAADDKALRRMGRMRVTLPFDLVRAKNLAPALSAAERDMFEAM